LLALLLLLLLLLRRRDVDFAMGLASEESFKNRWNQWKFVRFVPHPRSNKHRSGCGMVHLPVGGGPTAAVLATAITRARFAPLSEGEKDFSAPTHAGQFTRVKQPLIYPIDQGIQSRKENGQSLNLSPVGGGWASR
jgi:hypothetical protein